MNDPATLNDITALLDMVNPSADQAEKLLYKAESLFFAKKLAEIIEDKDPQRLIRVLHALHEIKPFRANIIRDYMGIIR